MKMHTPKEPTLLFVASLVLRCYDCVLRLALCRYLRFQLLLIMHTMSIRPNSTARWSIHLNFLVHLSSNNLRLISNLRIQRLLPLKNNISRNTIRRLISQHDHRRRSQSHETETNTEANQRTSFRLRVHTIRNCLSDRLQTSKCSSVANVCLCIRCER